jgi:hypothetical protein
LLAKVDNTGAFWLKTATLAARLKGKLLAMAYGSAVNEGLTYDKLALLALAAKPMAGSME